jgi:WD40 repeat protein
MKVIMGEDGSDANYTPRNHKVPVHSVSWLTDGKHIVTGAADKVAYVWDATTKDPAIGEPFTFRDHTESVLSVAGSLDSKNIASGSADKTVRVWKTPL